MPKTKETEAKPKQLAPWERDVAPAAPNLPPLFSGSAPVEKPEESKS